MNRTCSTPYVVAFCVASYAAAFVATAHVVLYVIDKATGRKP